MAAIRNVCFCPKCMSCSNVNADTLNDIDIVLSENSYSNILFAVTTLLDKITYKQLRHSRWPPKVITLPQITE